ncbi:hypothetical protein PR048_011801 [Dryococelus australis]|uniref:Uncharacterized protein n=1 Tax=Dryococelus australis TaxID=614101 RepID=A0ABQ9HMN0_9NEOP|nr:hypothetical protein PR048_011801 [Dryococelus australis]
MPFAVPVVWRECINHSDDCYFCSTKTEGYSKKKKCKIEYPNVPSAIRPVPHGVGLPIPTPTVNWTDVGSSPSEEEDQPHTTDSFADPTTKCRLMPATGQQHSAHDRASC